MGNRKDNKGHVLQKGETQRKDGRYVYSYINVLGKRRQVYGATLAELREKEKKITINTFNGIVDTNITLDQLFERYLRDRQYLAPATLYGNTRAYEKHIKEGFGKRKIKELRNAHFVEFYSHLLTNNLAAGTVKNIHGILSAMMKIAIRNDLILKDPTDGAFLTAKNHVSAESSHPRSAITPAQTKAFMSYLYENHRHDYRMFLFMLLTGVRSGEFSALLEEDVDLDKRVVHINRSYSRIGGVKGTKTRAGVRDIPLCEEAVQIVKEELEWKHSKAFYIRPDPNLFVGAQGRMQKNNNMNVRLQKYIDEYNALAASSSKPTELLPNISCHIFRHTFCARACESGMNTKALQTIMGHSDITTTMNVYAEVSYEYQQDEIDRLARHMRVSGGTNF